MQRIFKIFGYIFIFLMMSFLLLINIKLHLGPNLENQNETKQSVVKQLNYLENQLKQNGLGKKMQESYPEGFVFINTLYGLTWAEVGQTEEPESILKNKALDEARYAYNQINSSLAKSNFDIELNPEYGIFYRGWKNYLLAEILSIQIKKDSSEIAEFNAGCNDIAHAFANSKNPYIESYFNSSWPADAFVAVASLKLHDEMFGPTYENVINEWLAKVKTKVDPETKLIPHSTDAESGEIIEGTRGSSISILLIFLADIDPEFAEQQFKIFHDRFSITRLKLPAIREYPKGKYGNGDIDSGPVIFDIGFAGTIVSIGTYKKYGEYEIANRISHCVEGFGFPSSSDHEKKYLFGKMPIADAFIAWSRMQNANKNIIKIKGENSYELGSIAMFHLFSAIFLLSILVLLFRKKLIRLVKNNKL